MANPGAWAPASKNTYTEEEIAALAAFVASLGPGPAIPTEEQYSGEGLSPEELAKGSELFTPTAPPATTSRGRAAHYPTASTLRAWSG